MVVNRSNPLTFHIPSLIRITYFAASGVSDLRCLAAVNVAFNDAIVNYGDRVVAIVKQRSRNARSVWNGMQRGGSAEHRFAQLHRANLETACDYGFSYSRGNTLLHRAVAMHKEQIVATILARCRPSLVNLRNMAGDTPLLMAFEHAGIARLLLAHPNCDPTLTAPSNSRTVLHNSYWSVACTEALLADLRCRALIDAIDVEGKTVLHRAAEQGRSEVTQLLLQNGADCNVRHPRSANDTPLHRACRKGALFSTRLLVEQEGAAVNAVNANGVTPLHLACERQCAAKCVEALLASGRCDVTLRTRDEKWTALHIAARDGQTPSVFQALAAHPSFHLIKHARDFEDKTPLQVVRADCWNTESLRQQLRDLGCEE